MKNGADDCQCSMNKNGKQAHLIDQLIEDMNFGPETKPNQRIHQHYP
jgi:hypothetical protein